VSHTIGKPAHPLMLVKNDDANIKITTAPAAFNCFSEPSSVVIFPLTFTANDKPGWYDVSIHGTKFRKRVCVFKVEIDGYVNGETGRTIDNCVVRSSNTPTDDDVRVITAGHVKFEADITPTGLVGLGYEWTFSDGKPDAANTAKTINWNAPTTEADVTVTLKVKDSAGTVICTKMATVKPVKPRVVRVRFIDDDAGNIITLKDEGRNAVISEYIAGSWTPQYDRTNTEWEKVGTPPTWHEAYQDPFKNESVAYVKGGNLRVVADVAATDEPNPPAGTANTATQHKDLSALTPIKMSVVDATPALTFKNKDSVAAVGSPFDVKDWSVLDYGAKTTFTSEQKLGESETDPKIQFYFESTLNWTIYVKDKDKDVAGNDIVEALWTGIDVADTSGTGARHDINYTFVNNTATVRDFCNHGCHGSCGVQAYFFSEIGAAQAVGIDMVIMAMIDPTPVGESTDIGVGIPDVDGDWLTLIPELNPEPMGFQDSKGLPTIGGMKLWWFNGPVDLANPGEHAACQYDSGAGTTVYDPSFGEKRDGSWPDYMKSAVAYWRIRTDATPGAEKGIWETWAQVINNCHVIKWKQYKNGVPQGTVAWGVHHFKVDVTSSQTAGAAFNVTVTAQDMANNTVADFCGTVTLTQTGGTAGGDGPPKVGVHIKNTAVNTDDSYTFVAAENGVHTFSVTAYTAETITKFTASSGGKSGDSGAVDVKFGALDHFKVESASPQTAGTAFNVTVTAQDAWNNTKTDFVGATALTQTGGTAGGDGPPKVGVHIINTAVNTDDSYTFVAADNGVHAFPLTAYTAETITKFTAASGGKSGDSGAVVVNRLHHFKVDVASPQTAGGAFNVTVTAQDWANNTVADFCGSVTLTQAGGTAGGDGPPKVGVHIKNTAVNTDDNYTFVVGDNGVHAFSVTAYTAETITKFTASSGGKSGDSGAVVLNP
jgi:hypothetical protein